MLLVQVQEPPSACSKSASQQKTVSNSALPLMSQLQGQAGMLQEQSLAAQAAGMGMVTGGAVLNSKQL